MSKICNFHHIIPKLLKMTMLLSGKILDFKNRQEWDWPYVIVNYDGMFNSSAS